MNRFTEMVERNGLCGIHMALLCLLAAGCARMDAQAQPRSEATALLQYIDSWGMKGSEPGHLDEPTSIATDALGNVFIADAGSRFIDKFDEQGTPLLAFQDDWIKSPQAIAIDRGGAIYAADPGRGTLSVFLPSGDRYRDLRLKSHPNGEDTLSVSVADDGMIFVLDKDSGQVFVYTPGFRLEQTWRPFANGGGSRSRASAVACGPDGYVYVLDGDNNRIIRFSESGHVVSEIVERRAEANRRLGDQFAVASGYVFLMDGDGLTLHVFTADGTPKLDFDLTPQLGNQHRFVPALAVSPRHELFVLDPPDSRVLRYRINF